MITKEYLLKENETLLDIYRLNQNSIIDKEDKPRYKKAQDDLKRQIYLNNKLIRQLEKEELCKAI